MTGVFACDIFAYFGGMLFGKHKLAPIVSPKKSWEGAIIGGVFATGYILLMLLAFDYAPYDSSLLFFGYGFMQMNYLWWIAVTIFAIAIVILTILGDLLFSWFKRANRIKDFGTILPGHGGILDRLDAVLVVSLIVGSAMGLTYFVASFVCHDFTLFFVV
jgi:phosphatidate cytidylyltransferase